MLEFVLNLQESHKNNNQGQAVVAVHKEWCVHVCVARERVCCVKDAVARAVTWFHGLGASMVRSTWCRPAGTQ